MLRSLVGSEMCIRDRRNISQWARLLNETGRAAVIENCHNGNNPAVAIDQGGCPDYHVFRTSGDIKNNYASWIGNALTVNDYAISNRTGPTCWAYPDMSMIGVQGQTPDEAPGGPWTNFSQPSITEQRTHFGLWAVLSSPLTLSLDFGNGSAVDGVWDLISNVELLRVNQAWAGGAGSIFAADHQRNVTLRSDCTRDLVVPSWQAWYKPLPGQGAAIFVANHGDNLLDAGFQIRFEDVPGLGGGMFRVVDVWAQEAVAGIHAGYNVSKLGRHDSVFLTLLPA
eukprot:TRINITY_DN16169_c0_g1_i1.p1 TRINITY_DN16169_c0_g1~~TRINITY_DN16169_c0_g1_i1.p1  ORF type:complete len:282 (+),score=59.12 TRINITY_DN16169_c0_g1_i1:132-977(+)